MRQPEAKPSEGKNWWPRAIEILDSEKLFSLSVGTKTHYICIGIIVLLYFLKPRRTQLEREPKFDIGGYRSRHGPVILVILTLKPSFVSKIPCSERIIAPEARSIRNRNFNDMFHRVIRIKVSIKIEYM